MFGQILYIIFRSKEEKTQYGHEADRLDVDSDIVEGVLCLLERTSGSARDHSTSLDLGILRHVQGGSAS